MARPAIVMTLPSEESDQVFGELALAGFEVITVDRAVELESILDSRRDIAVAILDGEIDDDEIDAFQRTLHEDGREIPALTVVSARDFERLAAADGRSGNEYFTRPYTASSIRWRVEAMCIRQETVDDGSGPVLQPGPEGHEAWNRRATMIAVFNPKGGVGKTTIATNLASSLQGRKGKAVLLIDADTVTGHVTSSLAIEAHRTVADSWRDEADGGPSETFVELASPRMRPACASSPSTDSPINTEILDPERVKAAIKLARRSFDVIVVDLHPSYSELNQAIFDEADRIIVPVTPDVPAIRAAVQFLDVALALGCRERVSTGREPRQQRRLRVGHRAHPRASAFAQIRSAGMLFVRAANEGRTVTEMFPREKISADFDTLADRVLGKQKSEGNARSGFRFPARIKENPARA